MSKLADGANAALQVYPDDVEQGVRLFIGFVGADRIDIEYELGITIEEHIYGKSSSPVLKNDTEVQKALELLQSKGYTSTQLIKDFEGFGE